jgi:hypothetical protein
MFSELEELLIHEEDAYSDDEDIVSEASESEEDNESDSNDQGDIINCRKMKRTVIPLREGLKIAR